ncbi:MAG: hypothetical protein KF838_15835 [Phycisphaeraceae bacterium]|nr:MAG: hypothetical protein KF838_15835 [Phycisphaeraceae bacterium]
MPGESVNKVCCKCEVDVSQAKRHKDAKGRYWCEPCFAKAAAEAKGGASQGKPDAASGAATPAWLAGSLAVEGKRCTACSAPMPKEGVICTSCGHNSETGKAMGTRVVMAPKEKAPKASKGPSLLGGLGGALQGPAAVGFSVVGGAVGGGIGACIWAMIAKSLQVEIGYIAALVGMLAGGGVAVIAGNYRGMTTGIIAAVIAVAAVMGGRYWAISMIADEFVGKMSRTEMRIQEEDAPYFLAREVTSEWEASGQLKNWISNVSREDAEKLEDFPKEIQTETMRRWTAKSSAERAAYVRVQQDRFNQGAKEYLKENVFMDSFDLIDGIFIMVAIGVAFGIGSGGSFNDD